MACSLFLSNSLSPYSSREEAEHVQKLRPTYDERRRKKTQIAIGHLNISGV